MRLIDKIVIDESSFVFRPRSIGILEKLLKKLREFRAEINDLNGHVGLASDGDDAISTVAEGVVVDVKDRNIAQSPIFLQCQSTPTDEEVTQFNFQ